MSSIIFNVKLSRQRAKTSDRILCRYTISVTSREPACALSVNIRSLLHFLALVLNVISIPYVCDATPSVSGLTYLFMFTSLYSY